MKIIMKKLKIVKTVEDSKSKPGGIILDKITINIMSK